MYLDEAEIDRSQISEMTVKNARLTAHGIIGGKVTSLGIWDHSMRRCSYYLFLNKYFQKYEYSIYLWSEIEKDKWLWIYCHGKQWEFEKWEVLISEFLLLCPRWVFTFTKRHHWHVRLTFTLAVTQKCSMKTRERQCSSTKSDRLTLTWKIRLNRMADKELFSSSSSFFPTPTNQHSRKQCKTTIC